jgi:hypothetical protein
MGNRRNARKIAFAITDSTALDSASINHALIWMKLHVVQGGDTIVLIYFPPKNRFRGIELLQLSSVHTNGWQLLHKYANQCEYLGLQVNFPEKYSCVKSLAM